MATKTAAATTTETKPAASIVTEPVTTPAPDAAAAAAAAATAAAATPPDAAAAAAAAATTPATEPKPEVKGTASTEPGTPKAPAKYELKVPDEAKRFVTAAVREQFETMARENDWTLEEAQQDLDARLAATMSGHQKTVEAWTERTTADAEFGGTNLAATKANSTRAFNYAFPEGDPLRDEAIELMEAEGYGNHLVVVAMLARFGRAMAEDKPTFGKPAGKGPVERLPTKDAMWPDPPKP